MKAIGKGSLASILAAGLHIVRIAIYIAFFFLCVMAIAIPLAPLIAPLIERFRDVEIHTDFSNLLGEYVKLMSYFVTVGVMLYVVDRLLEILRTLRFGSPFVRENADRFKRVGFALLAGEAAKFVFALLGRLVDKDIAVRSELTAWVAIIAVFVLAEVFLEGAKMKEEQDLTV